MKPTIDYGQQIKEMLREKGLEQKELAKELGTSYMNVNKTLNGHGHTMTPKNYDRYLQAVKLLEIRKECDILIEAHRQNIENSNKALEKIEKLRKK